MAWLEKVGISVPDAAKSMYQEAPVADKEWLANLGWPGDSYAVVTFASRADAEDAFGAFDDGWGSECGPNAKARRAWSDTHFTLFLISKCTTTGEVVRLFSHQMSRRLRSLSGEECVAALLRIDRTSRRNPRRDYERYKRAAERLMPRLAPFVHDLWQPHNRTLMAQQSLIASLLERVVLLAPLLPTTSLAQVVMIISRLEKRGIGLPAGMDWRSYGFPGMQNETDLVSRGPPLYGYVGLGYRVFLELSEMRNSTVLEAAIGCGLDEMPAAIKAEGKRKSKAARRRAKPPSLNPHVPVRQIWPQCRLLWDNLASISPSAI